MAIIYDGSMDTKLNKQVLSETIAAIAAEDKDVVYLDADLMNSSGTLGFWQKNKDQAINVGIAEANMIGIAAGLSAGGKKPYAHSFGPFASRRCYDQVFLSVGYAGNSLRILGSDPGVTAAFNGGTHMPFEDMALMRAIPNSTVLDISDATQLEWALKNTKDLTGVIYLRFTRKNFPRLYSDDHEFKIGKGEVIKAGTDATIFACGLMVGVAMEAATDLEKEGKSIEVIDLFSVKPIDKGLVVKSAAKTGKVLVAENHNVIGGLGDAVGSVILEEGVATKFKKLGINEQFGSVGPQNYLQEFYGLTKENVIKQISSLC